MCSSRSDHQRLSDIFVQKGPYLKMYSTYIRQFDNNVALLDEQCRKNTAFAAVVKEFEVGQEKGLCLLLLRTVWFLKVKVRISLLILTVRLQLTVSKSFLLCVFFQYFISNLHILFSQYLN